jgi:hypothetical protein
LPIFSFISNAAIHKIRRFLSNPPGYQDSPQFQILPLKIWLVLIKISSLPRFSWNFNATILRDPQVIIKISRLPRFSLKIHRISSKPQSLQIFVGFNTTILKIRRFSSISRAAQIFWYIQMIHF